MALPLEQVILTFPDERSASSAQPLIGNDRIQTTCDPFGARVGSGGGTLHALSQINPTESVLILHAGGASSRCPTQMVLGKAWTPLPCNGSISTPLHVWLDQCQTLFPNIPKGSVVVIASDTLLRLPQNIEIDWKSISQNTVIGLAVPAPLETAKNHGVYCFDRDDTHTETHRTQLHLCRRVLQKPSMEELQKETSNEFAWIDTGVVIFPPKAAAVLHELSKGPLSLCTGAGLQKAASVDDDGDDLSKYAQDHALSVDLYTHILRALSITSIDTEMSFESYRMQNPDLDLPVAKALHDSLHGFSLNIWAIEGGDFLHLGTTRELVDFYVHGCCREDHEQSTCPSGTSRRHQLCRQFGSSLGLTSYVNSMTSYCSFEERVIVMGSCLESCQVESGTVIDSCRLQIVKVGKDCMISSLDCDNADIPRGMVVQEHVLPCNSHVFMVIGVDDNIKSEAQVFGSDLNDFLKWADLDVTDLWDDATTNRCLWNARLHPVVPADQLAETSLSSLYSWLPLYTEGQSPNRSIDQWKRHRRVSFCYIRNHADASVALQRVQQVQSEIIPRQRTLHVEHVQDLLLTQSNDFVDLDFCRQSCKDSSLVTLLMFQEVVQYALREKQYLVASRALLLSYSLTTKTEATLTAMRLPDNYDVVESMVTAVRNEKDVSLLFEDFVQEHCNAIRNDTPVRSTGWIRLARECISKNVRAPSIPVAISSNAVVDSWIVVQAPVRVDIAGGWTDTPPIGYEYRSCVTGLAIKVDGHLPLSCRVRLKRYPQWSISLTTESRDKEGNLVSYITATVPESALDDYQNPLADVAILKCALKCLDIESVEDLAKLVGRGEPMQLQIISASMLPHGSGLGTSSILAGCVLQAISRALGIPEWPMAQLVDLVLHLEQLLTTGGGFQDQVNGLCPGGAKFSQFDSRNELQFQALAIESDFIDILNCQLLLIYTGTTRLAKNLLNQVLIQWAHRSPIIVSTVDGLIETAKQAQEALLNADVKNLGQCLSSYWQQKKIMAGKDAEPPHVTELFELIQMHVWGASLCGAGGGGFMVVLAKDVDAIKQIVAAKQLTCHACTLDTIGLTTMIKNDRDVAEIFRG